MNVYKLEWTDAPEKGDAYDFFEKGNTVDEVRELLAALSIDRHIPIDSQHLRLTIYGDLDHPGTGAVLIRLEDVKREKVRWLWEGWIPLAKLTVLDGDPGLGKSLTTLDITARVSTGRPMPDGSRGDLKDPESVVIMSAEDGLGDTIRPRLEAAGADCERIFALQAIGEGDDARLPDLTDLDAVRESVQQHDAKLVIIDPLMAFLPSDSDAHRDQDVRRILAPLARLAEERARPSWSSDI